jgi:hypothetical protein
LDEAELTLATMENFASHCQWLKSNGRACDVTLAADWLDARANELLRRCDVIAVESGGYCPPSVTFTPIDADELLAGVRVAELNLIGTVQWNHSTESRQFSQLTPSSPVALSLPVITAANDVTMTSPSCTGEAATPSSDQSRWPSTSSYSASGSDSEPDKEKSDPAGQGMGTSMSGRQRKRSYSRKDRSERTLTKLNRALSVTQSALAEPGLHDSNGDLLA